MGSNFKDQWGSWVRSLWIDWLRFSHLELECTIHSDVAQYDRGRQRRNTRARPLTDRPQAACLSCSNRSPSFCHCERSAAIWVGKGNKLSSIPVMSVMNQPSPLPTPQIAAPLPFLATTIGNYVPSFFNYLSALLTHRDSKEGTLIKVGLFYYMRKNTSQKRLEIPFLEKIELQQA